MSIVKLLLAMAAAIAFSAVASGPAAASASPGRSASQSHAAAAPTADPSVQAGTCGTVTGDGVRMRTQPNGTSTILGLAYRGDRVGYRGGTSGDWDYVYNHRSGVTGWINRYYVSWDPVGSAC